ncbi:MAG TPA: SDR family oxidoreductase, partial [Geobacteraceae bacterium]
LEWFGLQALRDRVETTEVDFMQPLCGLAPDRYQALCARAGQIIHCASDTRFSEQHRRQSTATNVESLVQIIELARNCNAPWFHYVSTAYAAGTAVSFCPEAPVTAETFVNVYEETKARAEREVAGRCQMHGIPFTIIRPSIVYGDSSSGRANRFNALYTNVKSLYYISEIYRKDIHEHGGRKARECGISLDDQGVLHLPLQVAVAHQGHVNLISIDYFVTATLAILEQAQPGAIYHLTSDNPKTLEELASYCEKFLHLHGIKIVYGQPNTRALTPPEAMFNRFIEPYLPYLADTRTFERSNTIAATADLHPPELNYDVFARCMAYAVRVNWGRGLLAQL